MGNFELDEDDLAQPIRREENSFIIRFMRSVGIPDSSIPYVLTGIVIIGFIATIVIFYQTGQSTVPKAQLEQGRIIDQSQFSQFNR